MDRMQQGSEELYQSILEMTAQKKRKDEQVFEQLQNQKEELEKRCASARAERDEADKRERESDNACAVLASRLAENEKNLSELQKKTSEERKAFPFLLREQIKDRIAEKETERSAKAEKKSALEKEREVKNRLRLFSSPSPQS